MKFDDRIHGEVMRRYAILRKFGRKLTFFFSLSNIMRSNLEGTTFNIVSNLRMLQLSYLILFIFLIRFP